MKVKYSAFILAILCVFLFGCSNLSIENKNSDSNYGSILINQITDADRALELSSIRYAKAYVDGTGITDSIKSTSDVSVSNGKGSISVENIPIGSNRIVTVEALDSSKVVLQNVLIRNVFDISSNEEKTISVSWNTTAYANVLYELKLLGYDLEKIGETQKEKITNSISTSVHALLVDSKKIAEDFKNNGEDSLGSSSSYIMIPATLDVSYTEANNYKVQVCDPSSKVIEGTSADGCVVNSIYPGTWDVVLIDSLGAEILRKEDVTFTSGETVTLSLDPINGLYLHARDGYLNCYIWNTIDASLNKTHNEMTQENSSWYSIKFNNLSSASIIFTKAIDDWTNQSGDLSRTEVGEFWWVPGTGEKSVGTWYDYCPDDVEEPVFVSFTVPSQVVSGNAEILYSVTDNVQLDKIEFYVANSLVKTVELSGKSKIGSYYLDTAYYSNGDYEIYAKVYDKVGLFATTKTESITTDNINPAPVAIITGASLAEPSVTKTYSAESSYDKNGTIKGYKWSVSGGATISGESTKSTVTVIMPSSESTVTVSLTITDNEGATTTTSQTVNVKVNTRTDFREESIYFLMTARFYDGDTSNDRYCRADDNSGNRANNDPPWRGDFKGLIEKLDYIKALGFSAVWITPPVLNRSDFDFHGYHAWDMTKVDPRLESIDADYQDLINACHAKGLKVIQDVVLNHSSRYGLDNFFVPKYWGDRDDADWGSSSEINYYDVYNSDFHYNGLDAEPNSGKTWYNGDLWQKEKPTLSWNPDLSDWGVLKGTNTEGRKYYGFQWPTLSLFDPDKFHTTWLGNWEDYTCQSGTIHEDCIDLNTESATTQKYLIDAYTKYIDMGVDAFRIDTVKHVSRVMFNRHFIPAFKEAGGENFYMFGEVCTRVNEVWNHGVPPLSTPFYTWKERSTYSSNDTEAALEGYNYENNLGTSGQPTSDNHYLNGNLYHTPDYSNASGLNVIDFPMHWNFSEASAAYNMRQEDKYYNDSTWNVVYVDSHDYGPNTDNRYAGGTDAWAENMTYMWTFRGIPCLYYGSEIEFQAGAIADKGAAKPLAETGRAYYGDHLEGSITATDFGEWTDVSGELENTMSKPLVGHVARLNKIRRVIPALQKGQYSTDDCSGNMAFKRRYTDDSVDSFVLVTISGDATFSGIPNGTYIDVVTGDSKNVTNGSLSTSGCSGKGNARIYVLQGTKGCQATGKISGSDTYLK